MKSKESLEGLFLEAGSKQSETDASGFAPLASRMRPRSLEEFVGQGHLLGPNALLRKAIEADLLTSLVIFGPPGCGKTSLAYCISQKTQSRFEAVNAVVSNVGELRQVIAQAKTRRRSTGQKTILFIDEIHRFSKAQQDVLMPDVEDGSVTLVGATVYNPFFSLAAPLLSRSLVFELQRLSLQEVVIVLRRAMEDPERGFGRMGVVAEDLTLEFLASACEGDARRSLNALELGIMSLVKEHADSREFRIQDAQECVQKKAILYDKDGDSHYDTISAFIKSMRGGDPDAVLYWLARMIHAGEDPRFIARRICICAAEDVGLADPQALVLAQAAFSVTEMIGMPEARIPLAEAAVYVACAPKSNAAYLGIDAALEEVRRGQAQRVPESLKDASYAGAKRLGRGQGYLYPHDYPQGIVDQVYMEQPRTFYQPKDSGYEQKIKERLERWSRLKQERIR